ncbi:MAG: hypothetical protein K0R17_2232 [Rariglobus sp.]|jgi:hypothetical protein|nr:hypothetical protein [Rariglobus sp.]
MKIIRSLFLAGLTAATALAQQSVRVDNTTKVVVEPPTFWTANAAEIIAALGSPDFNGTIEAASFVIDNGSAGKVAIFGGAHDGNIDVYMPDGGGTLLVAEQIGETVQGYDADLTLIGALSTTSYGRATLSLADAAAGRAYFGVVIGTNVQAFDADLGALAANSTAGFWVAGTNVARSINVTAPLTVTNPAGTAGNPLIGVNPASDTATGVVELATAAEAVTGTDTARAITPAGNRAALTSYVDPIALTRVGSDQVISDAVTSNRAQVQVPGTRGNLAGVGVATWRGLVTVPSSNPATTSGVFAVQSSAAPLGGVFSLCSFIGTTGALSIEQQGTPVNSHINKIIYPAFRSTYSGQTGILEVDVTVSSVAVRWNDVDISSAFSAANIGTPPPWLDSALVSTYHLTGYNWPAGPAPLGCWILGALSADDRTYWRTTGKPPAWVTFGGSAALLVNSNFAAGVDGWSAANGALVGNVDGIAGVDDVLEINTAGVAGSGAAGNVGFGSVFPTGSRLRVRFDVYRPSTNTVGTWVGIRDSDSRLSNQAVQPAADTWVSYDLVCNFDSGGPGGLQLRLSVSASSGGALGAGDKIYFKNVRVNRLGALSLPGVQPIAVMDDWTGIGGNQARLVGMNPITERRDFRIVGRTATNGNEQLLGSAVFDEVNRYRISSWTINNLGTSKTVSLGNISAGTAYASGITAGAGLSDTTLATRFNATTSLWVNSNGTDTLVHTIAGQRIGNN